MIDYEKLAAGSIGTILSATGASLSVTEIQAIVSIICTIIGLLITIITAVVIPVWKKIRDAKKDGVITPEEAEDIANTAKDGLDKVQNIVSSKKDEEGESK